MTERLLQFIWQFQYFNKNELETTDGQHLSIVRPGQYNTHQGPDFLEGMVRIGETSWAGNIELHVRASDWERHAHQSDPNYQNVILHVIWQDDEVTPGHSIPTLLLADRIPKILLHQYNTWMESSSFIPCQSYLPIVEDLVWESWKDRLLLERLFRKAAGVRIFLTSNRGHWEETLWWMVARNFGLQVNAEAFEELARSIPLKLLIRHQQQIQVLEALLMGQAGLLEGRFTESYPVMLQKEYRFYRSKYNLRKIGIPVHFLRMRPAGFPTVRLAQLAMLLHKSSRMLSEILQAEDHKTLENIFRVTANDYWHYHFRFDEPSAYQPKTLGGQMVNSVMVNTVIPLIFAYGSHHHSDAEKNRAVEWLSRLAPEKNSITLTFLRLGVSNTCASASQALIELKSQYCDKRRCLDCSIGNAIIRRKL